MYMYLKLKKLRQWKKTLLQILSKIQQHWRINRMGAEGMCVNLKLKILRQ